MGLIVSDTGRLSRCRVCPYGFESPLYQRPFSNLSRDNVRQREPHEALGEKIKAPGYITGADPTGRCSDVHVVHRRNSG